MKNKRLLLPIVVGVIVSAAIITILQIVLHVTVPAKAETISVKRVESEIVADGAIGSENEATLHFQTGGKLVYLPFKEGDTVQKGQVVASLDATVLKKQLEQALATYRSTRTTFDQAQQNNQTGVLQGQQKYQLEVLNKAGKGGQEETDIINDMAKRIIDQNQASLDSSVLTVEIANQALALASIISPVNGVITHEDVTTTNVNVTPSMSFSVVDPNALIFKANVPEAYIAYVTEGTQAQIKLTGVENKPISGTVVKIYPDKVKLPSGESVYRVDIKSDDLNVYAKYGQGGTVLIKSTAQENVLLIPAWTVLNKKYIWVLTGDTPKLVRVTVGKRVGEDVEILSGIQNGDRVIVNPDSIISQKYRLP